MSVVRASGYYGMVRDLAARAELPMPRVYVMDSPQPNAFATGRSPSRSAVCASTACSTRSPRRRWRA